MLKKANLSEGRGAKLRALMRQPSRQTLGARLSAFSGEEVRAGEGADAGCTVAAELFVFTSSFVVDQDNKLVRVGFSWQSARCGPLQGE